MAVTALRKSRIAAIKGYRAQGLSASQIGKRMGIAKSTVLEYERDPYRERARKRQLRYAVDPAVQLNGGEVTALHKTRKFTPHKGKGKVHNAARSRQVRALIGWGARR